MNRQTHAAFVTVAFGWSILFAPAAPAAPEITGAAGTFVHKSPITISGSGFGVKNPAAPLKWDDFEGGITGNDLGNGWYIENRGGPNPRYTSDQLRPNSTLSAKQVYIANGQYGNIIGLTGLPATNTSYYVSLQKYVTTSGGESRNFKMLAFRSGPAGNWDIPGFTHALLPSVSAEQFYVYACGSGPAWSHWPGFAFPKNSWNRWEYYVDRGTPGVADGRYFHWLDGALRYSMADWMFYPSDCTSSSFWSNLYLDGYFATDTNDAGAEIWHDDVYIDTTQARIELCDASAWSARSRCEIQVPSAWSAASVTATANRGAFACGQQAYLYVIDADGNVNADGFPVTLCSGGDMIAPAAPTNLQVQ